MLLLKPTTLKNRVGLKVLHLCRHLDLGLKVLHLCRHLDLGLKALHLCRHVDLTSVIITITGTAGNLGFVITTMKTTEKFRITYNSVNLFLYRKDDKWTASEPDIRTMYDCPSIRALRLQNLAEYDDLQRRMIREQNQRLEDFGKKQLEVEAKKHYDFTYRKAREQDRLNRHRYLCPAKKNEGGQGLAVPHYYNYGTKTIHLILSHTFTVAIIQISFESAAHEFYSNPMRQPTTAELLRLGSLTNFCMNHWQYKHSKCKFIIYL